MPPEGADTPAWLMALPSLGYILSVAFWLWMCVDCYRRRGGLDPWHFIFFFFPPSTVLYFILNRGIFFRGSSASGGLFGLSLRSRIRKLQNQLRIADIPAVRFELAELQFQNGQYRECEPEFAKIAAQEARNLDAWYYLGQCRLQSGDAAGALEALQHVVDGDRKLRFGLAWLRYTDCLLAVQRREEALEQRRKLAREFPRPLTEFAYAQLLAEAGQKEKARQVLDDMLATSHEAPREDRTWLRRGRSLLRSLS